MGPKIVVDGEKIISFGYSNYLISGTQELVEIGIDDWPIGVRKKDVYWDGSKVVTKTQDMINQESQIKKDKEDKEELDNKVLTKLIEILNQMINDPSPSDFNILIENLKAGVIE